MLTDYVVEHAKPGPKPIRLSDSRGLYLAVLPNGSKLWRLDFRFDGRRLTASFGPYPDITLACQRRPKIRPCGVRKVYQAAPEKRATQRHRWRMERAPAGALSMRGGGLGGVRR